MSAPDPVLAEIESELEALRASGAARPERVLRSPQRARPLAAAGPEAPSRPVLNLCSNNYLGLADAPALLEAAREALESRGLGMASVRFICGSSDLHHALEEALARLVGAEDAVLLPSCFEANGGLFEPLLGAEDAVVSDSLNHASVIDGIRLCKARRLRFPSRDMGALDAALRDARAGGARRVLVATDGVFSMDGVLAPLAETRALCDRHGAWLMVDDCHATGVLGPGGAGSAAAAGVRAEITTGTLGKALGGGAGGFVAAAAPVVALLRARARPYLFSNATPPPMAAAALAAVEIARGAEDARARLAARAALWRGLLEAEGFALAGAGHPIVPVMTGGADAAAALADALWEEGVLVAPFAFPVVPRGAARVRTQVSSEMTEDDLRAAAALFGRCARAAGGEALEGAPGAARAH